MITINRSWTHDDTVPNLIGRKTIDWSMFKYGTTIPDNFKAFFIQANGGKEIESGSGEAVTLLCEGQTFRAALRNVDQSSVKRQTFQLRYHNEELKQLMKSTFRATYQYIQRLRPQDQNGDSRTQIKVPDELAEYVEFYRTQEPYVYEMRLIPLQSLDNQLPNIWWVNQGATLSEEHAGQFMWAPLSGKGGRSQYHWDTMDEVRDGDIVLHYASGNLHYVSRAVADVQRASKPESLSNSAWEEEGRLVSLRYFPLAPPIPLTEFAQEIMRLDIHHGPIHSSAGVKQGYLFRFTHDGLRLIQSKSPEVSWPSFTLFDTHIQPLSEEGETDLLQPIDDDHVQQAIAQIKTYIRHRGFHFPDYLVENFYLSLKAKPFVILAGVSGTGKTKLVQLFAEAVGATKDNQQFTLIPVRPDWSDPSDLLGYKDLSGRFRPGRLTTVLVEAAKPSNSHRPYFICLDEMNLARVEYYFSDLLSILETQEWEQNRIVTRPLIQANSVEGEDQKEYGNLSLPDNVYLIGTVNMDETTHPFSKKVLDRANTIEFNDINLQQFPEVVNHDKDKNGYEQAPSPLPNSFLRSEYIQLVDMYVKEQELVHRITEKLTTINGILEQIHSHVGFRIRDAVCFYATYNKRFNLLREDEAVDLQLLQKILPRIQGSSISVKRVLLQLLAEATGESISIHQYMEDSSELYERWGAEVALQAARYPHTTRKLAFMLRRLDEDGFTSYWLS